MSITLDELTQTAHLAYLAPEDAKNLLEPFNAVLKQMEGLKHKAVAHLTALSHPIPAIQPLREDTNSAPSVLENLAASARVFSEDYYLVPQVIEEE